MADYGNVLRNDKAAGAYSVAPDPESKFRIIYGRWTVPNPFINVYDEWAEDDGESGGRTCFTWIGLAEGDPNNNGGGIDTIKMLQIGVASEASWVIKDGFPGAIEQYNHMLFYRWDDGSGPFTPIFGVYVTGGDVISAGICLASPTLASVYLVNESRGCAASFLIDTTFATFLTPDGKEKTYNLQPNYAGWVVGNGDLYFDQRVAIPILQKQSFGQPGLVIFDHVLAITDNDVAVPPSMMLEIETNPGRFEGIIWPPVGVEIGPGETLIFCEEAD